MGGISANQYDIRDLKGRQCYAGLDLGATKDMTALVLVFADADGASTSFRFVGCPARRCKSTKKKTRCRIAYGGGGYLLTFPGRATDPKAVATKIAELHGMCKIKALAFDRWRIEDIKRELDAIGCNIELVPFGQGFKDLSPAVDVSNVWSSRVNWARRSPRVKYGGGQLPSRNGQRRKSKTEQTKSTGRIDPIVATAWRSAFRRDRGRLLTSGPHRLTDE